MGGKTSKDDDDYVKMHNHTLKEDVINKALTEARHGLPQVGEGLRDVPSLIIKDASYYNNIAIKSKQKIEQQLIDEKLATKNLLIKKAYEEIPELSLKGKFVSIIDEQYKCYTFNNEYNWWKDNIQSLNLSNKYNIPIEIYTEKGFFRVYFSWELQTENTP